MKRNTYFGCFRTSIRCRIFFLVLFFGFSFSVGGCTCLGAPEECEFRGSGRTLMAYVITTSFCLLQIQADIDTSDTLFSLPNYQSIAPKGSTKVDAAANFTEPLNTEKIRKLYNNTIFPCGDSENGYTLCGSAKKVEPGDFLVMVMQLNAKVPRKDPTYHYQYAFIFDASDAPNYQADAKYPNDFFQGTDLWYVANYTPQKGWYLEVSQMQAGSKTPVKKLDSQARLVLKDDVIMLVVPAREFQNKQPPYRMTAFKHKGDYGIDPPHDWNGHLVPPVAKGLKSFSQ